MAVHFKFRSAVAFDSINVEGNGITIGNLKDKISEQKNLGRGTNFDLVITNAESGEEYLEDTLLVPKNTSVIIKRVPAKRSKTTLSVHEPEDDTLKQPSPRSDKKDIDMAQLALTSPIDELYDMDDFGVDLYAFDESALTHVEADEISNASALVAKTVTDGKRVTQESLSNAQGYGRDAVGQSFTRGLGYGRAIPHAGYVCHRCGQPGHFIQHCPTNGDPAYDLKKVSRPRTDHEDLSTSPAVVLQSNNFFAKEADPLPPELRCSLCQGIFKEAVMIPCCQYSFCDTCLRQYLLEKGSCPQCSSEKSKNNDLLPNVALRQAIDRYAQLDVESATKAAKVPSLTTQSRKPSSTVKDLASVVVVDNQTDLPAVDDSVCESAIGSKEKNMYEGSKSFAGEASFLGKKKKKLPTRPGSISDMVSEHIAGKPRKVNRFCFVCGSPDHIARNCTTNGGDNNASFQPQRAMFHAVGAVPPRAITPFGQEMYWQGQSVVHVRPLPLGYGEGMYGPMPYGGPTIPVGPYGVSSYAPPMYPNPPMHGFLSGVAPRMVTPKERPLSREEFMELQERERRRRFTQERQEREPSEERPLSEAGSELSVSSGSGRSLRKQWPTAKKVQGSSWRHDLDPNFSKETVGIKSKPKRSRKLLVERQDEHMAPHHYSDESDDNSAFDESRGLRLYSQKAQQSIKPIPSMTRKSTKFYDRSASERINSDWDEGQNARLRVLKEEGHLKLSKLSTLGRYDAVPFEKFERNSYVKHDGTRVSDAGAAEMLHSSRHRTKKAALEGVRIIRPDHHVKNAAEMKDRHNHHGLASDEGGSIEVLKESGRKHHNQDRLNHHGLLSDEGASIEAAKEIGRKHHNQGRNEMVDDVSEDELKKKRKHKKHKVGGSKDASMGSALLDGVLRKSSSKRHKSSHNSLQVPDKSSVKNVSAAPELPIEESRWQMDDGWGDGNSSPKKERSKHKHHRSSKSAL
eukprot:c25310_g1_i2 orf=879-3782(-)